ncbi:MAG: hypothetical protein JW751_20710 [Polyangiaceae bacterium]|nr:hypothetical protein [Polyangiaceae bacterium]
MGLALEAAEPLVSWTRTLNEEDAFSLLDAASPGVSVQEWVELGHRLLPQASHARRRELIHIVRDELLDSREGVIVGSAWLRLLQEGSPHRRLGLLYGRLWQRRPLVLRALDELVHPRLERTGRPLAPLGADLIEGDDWDRFLRDCLRPEVPSEAFAKTRTTLQGALRAVGVIEITDTRERIYRVCHGRPDPLAFAWVVADELRGRGEASEAWALRSSFAARLFAPGPDYAAVCLDAGVSARLLYRSHLVGQAELHLGPEMS